MAELVRAHGPAIARAETLEEMMRVQAIAQLTPRFVGHEINIAARFAPPEERIVESAYISQRILTDMYSAYFSWNKGAADPNLVFPKGFGQQCCPVSGREWIAYFGSTLNDFMFPPHNTVAYSPIGFPKGYPFPGVESPRPSDTESSDEDLSE